MGKTLFYYLIYGIYPNVVNAEVKSTLWQVANVFVPLVCKCLRCEIVLLSF